MTAHVVIVAYNLSRKKYMLSSSSPVHLVCDAWVEVLWLLCIVYVIRAQPAELPR